MNLALLAEKNLNDFGEYVRLVFGEESYTNRHLFDRGSRLATALSNLGLAPGDRVVVILPNHPDVFVSYAAIWRAGLVAVPVLFLLGAHELRYILINSEAKAVITSADVHDKVVEASKGVESLRHIIAVGNDSAAGATSIDELVAKREPMAQAVARSSADLAVILYTSGTTGRPKGVMQTHGNLYANAMNSWNTAAVKDRRDTALVVLPLAHSFGLSVSVSGYLYGGKAILMRWFNPEEALSLIEKYRVTAMAGVPTMFVYMLHHPNADKYDTSSVTRWLVGAAPMPSQQLGEFERNFGGTMYVGYGLSEACPGVAVERENMLRKPGSTGVAVEGVEVKIVDDSGADLPRGKRGEIIVKGANVSPGYYGMPEATAETFRDGWLYTGDVGYLDDEGYLFIVERKKDLIIRAGFNVYPKDVEETLYRHPAVAEAAVVGVPDPLMGEEVCAFIVRKVGATASRDDLILHCQQDLAKYKTPKYLEFVDAMPKTTIGKIQKKELRRKASELWARQ